ncbi:hypothetical protein ACFL06_01075 [Patescibacteria group bacterium]
MNPPPAAVDIQKHSSEANAGFPARVLVYKMSVKSTTLAAMLVAFPVEVTSPVRLALVVTVSALPVRFPVKAPTNVVAVTVPVDGV